jgi:hypothetical protein
VALDLADDGRHGEHGEARAALGVEALDGDEGLEGHLLRSSSGSPGPEPPRQAARAHVLGHQRSGRRGSGPSE